MKPIYSLRSAYGTEAEQTLALLNSFLPRLDLPGRGPLLPLAMQEAWPAGMVDKTQRGVLLVERNDMPIAAARVVLAENRASRAIALRGQPQDLAPPLLRVLSHTFDPLRVLALEALYQAIFYIAHRLNACVLHPPKEGGKAHAILQVPLSEMLAFQTERVMLDAALQARGMRAADVSRDIPVTIVSHQAVHTMALDDLREPGRMPQGLWNGQLLFADRMRPC